MSIIRFKYARQKSECYTVCLCVCVRVCVCVCVADLLELDGACMSSSSNFSSAGSNRTIAKKSKCYCNIHGSV
jgi:hypothetical protein